MTSSPSVSVGQLAVVKVFWIGEVRVEGDVQLPVVGVEARHGDLVRGLREGHELAQPLPLEALQTVLETRPERG